MRLAAVAALLLFASPCAAQIKVPESCARVATAYRMPVPATLTRAAIKTALDGLALADQSNPDVKRCQDLLKAEMRK